ncbi:MAG: hypothetical protein SFV55_26575 [Haliscomenobacter sp.]|uniref:hypothetical protein n=1 Tax=Haliscomenobacter sp. TaxID=2717303 RepID=UPI0029B3071C|nr:hypothetical protein [Haliscomenobacter sp.]MDX2072027.1 hypothetical protein [Haliscomenobacter sp.]
MEVRKMILALIALLSAVMLQAQNSWFVEGKISSDDLQAVFMANVVAKSRTDSSIISFSFSSEQGTYRIEIPNAVDSCFLHVSALGFKEKWVPIAQDPLKMPRIALDMVLAIEILTMQAVVIKAEGPAIRLKNDTTEFRAASFSDGSERKVGELLKKLPGVSVAEDGSVFVNGRKVNKILVDGDDIWKGQSDLVTKHLPANIVDKIQSIEHYQDNGVMKGFEDSDEIALNLTVKEAVKFKNNVDLEGAWGLNNRKEINAHDFALLKKLKLAAIAGMNNTGKLYQLSEQNSLNSASSSDPATLADFGEPAINFEKFPVFQIDPSRFARNASKLGAISLNRSFSRFLKTQAYFAFSQDETTAYEFNEASYFLAKDTLSIQEQLSNQYKPMRWSNHFNATYGGNENLNIAYNASYSTTKEDAENQLNSSLNGRFSAFFTNHNRRFYQDLKSTVKLSPKQVLQLDFIHQIGRTPQTLLVKHLEGLQNDFFESSQQIQEAFADLHRINVSGKSLIKVNDLLKIKTQMGYVHSVEQFNSQLTSSKTIETPIAADDFLNRFSIIKSSAFLSTGFSVQLKRLKLFSDLKVQHQSLTPGDRSQTIFAPSTWLNVNPALGFGLALKGVSKVYGTYFQGNAFASPNELASGFIMQGYRNFQQSRSENLMNLTHTFVLGYFDFNLFKQSSLNFSIFSNVSNNAYSRFLHITDDYSFLTRVQKGKHKIFSLNASKDQLLSSLSTKVKFSAALSISSYPSGVNEQSSVSVARTISGAMTAQSAFPGPFNADLEFRAGASRVQSAIATTSRLYSQIGINGKYKFINWIRGGIHMDAFQKDLLNPDSKWLVFLDVQVMASPKNKPYFFEINGYNLTGLKWFETLSVGDAYNYFSGLRLNPALVLFKLGYSF